MNKIACTSILALSVMGLGLLGATAASAADAPLAAPDNFIGAQDVVLSVDAAGGVFANDTCLGTPTINAIANFTNGELDMHADGGFDYTTPAGFFGVRTFDYEMYCDGVSAGFQTATIVFSPYVPVGAADYYTTPQDTVLTVPANGVLANDTGALAVIDAINLPEGLTAQMDGSFVYAPPAGFVGDVTWSYRMSDGNDTLSDYIPVTISVIAVSQAIPETDDVDPGTELPTLAYTGIDDVTTWLIAPAVGSLALGALGIWASRRRAQLS